MCSPFARPCGVILPVILLLAVVSCPATRNNDDQSDEQALSRLGETLFFETALSASETVSCASCHIPMYAFADPQQFSVGQGGQRMDRNTPTVLNRPTVGFQFWDGRALSLAEQVIHPLETETEMGHSITAACQRLDSIARYSVLFAEAFGDGDIQPARLTTAIAAYLQTLQAYESDYDRWKAVGLLPSEILRGEQLFFGQARCTLCHAGPNFTDERFHNTGVAWRSGATDAGRGALTGRREDTRAFKTPTLRELIRTAPYMHDGSMATLDDVLQHYVDGGAPTDPDLDLMLQPLDLTQQEQTDLLAFLRALSDSRGPPLLPQQKTPARRS